MKCYAIRGFFKTQPEYMKQHKQGNPWPEEVERTNCNNESRVKKKHRREMEHGRLDKVEKNLLFLIKFAIFKKSAIIYGKKREEK